MVDDDPDIRSGTSELFASAGFDVEAAADGQGALHALDSGPFDVVLLDLTMPVMSGWRFLGEAARRADWGSYRVLVLSAAMPQGPLPATLVLSKPAGADTLLSAVRTCLSADPPAREDRARAQGEPSSAGRTQPASS